MEAASSAQPDSDTDELAEAFFNQPPYPIEPLSYEWEVPTMRRGELLAMQITIGTVTCGVLCALGLLLFR
jgi:hypothetical protein